MPLIALCRRVVDRPWFQNGVLAVIVLNAVLIGVATDSETLVLPESMLAAGWFDRLHRSLTDGP